MNPKDQEMLDEMKAERAGRGDAFADRKKRIDARHAEATRRAQHSTIGSGVDFERVPNTDMQDWAEGRRDGPVHPTDPRSTHWLEDR